METEQPAKKTKFKKSLPIILVVLVIGVIVAGIFLRPVFSGDSPLKADDDAASNVPIKVDLYQASVSLGARFLTPTTVKIKQGDSVAWLNKDGSMHLIVSDSGFTGFKGQGELLFGDMYLFTFNTVGTYAYHDQLNPALKGTVVVE